MTPETSLQPSADVKATVPREERRRIGILVVAYNAETTLASTLDRIPVDFRPRIDELLVFDDASADNTVHVALRWRAETTTGQRRRSSGSCGTSGTAATRRPAVARPSSAG